MLKIGVIAQSFLSIVLEPMELDWGDDVGYLGLGGELILVDSDGHHNTFGDLIGMVLGKAAVQLVAQPKLRHG